MFLTPWPSYARPFPNPAELLLRSLNEANQRSGPLVTAVEVEGGWELHANVPGLAVEDVKIELKGDTLTIHAEVKTDPPAGWSVVRRERAELAFTEQFRFFRPIDAERVEATVKDGVLTIRVPRVAEPTARVIPVLAH